MSKRRSLWIAVGLATLLVGMFATRVLWRRDPITVETYQRVHLGMARADVERLLGGPGLDDESFVVWLDNRSPIDTGHGTADLLNPPRGTTGIRYWARAGGLLILRFDVDGRVTDKEFLQVRESIFPRPVREWLLGW
jgi:hypothetical protein